MISAVRRYLFPEPQRPRPTGIRESGPPPVRRVCIVAVTAAMPAIALHSRLASLGIRSTIEHHRYPRRARASDLLVLLAPFAVGEVAGTARLADTLDDLERLADEDVRVAMVVVWSATDDERLELSAPRRTAPGYDSSAEARGWNATGILLASSWRRHLRAAGQDPASATELRDRTMRRLLRADSHAQVSGQNTARMLAVLERVDTDHVFAAIVEIGNPPSWYDLDSVAAAVAVRAASDS